MSDDICFKKSFCYGDVSMKQIQTNLFIGDDNDCLDCSGDFAVIHACKTCHKKVLGYERSLSPADPHYLVYQNDSQLYLNLVDMEEELWPKYTHPIVAAAFRFIDSSIAATQILVHCNLGCSRAPSLGMLYLAQKGKIDNSSYQAAKLAFTAIYPLFMPTSGIELYMEHYWGEILRL
jgi:hypothetical protein